MEKLEKIFAPDFLNKRIRTRALNFLRRLNLETVEQLREFLVGEEFTLEDLSRYRNVGDKTLAYIKQSLRQAGCYVETGTQEQERRVAEARGVAKFYGELLSEQEKVIRGCPRRYSEGFVDAITKYNELLRDNGLRIALLG